MKPMLPTYEIGYQAVSVSSHLIFLSKHFRDFSSEFAVWDPFRSSRQIIPAPSNSELLIASGFNCRMERGERSFEIIALGYATNIHEEHLVLHVFDSNVSEWRRYVTDIPATPAVEITNMSFFNGAYYSVICDLERNDICFYRVFHDGKRFLSQMSGRMERMPAGKRRDYKLFPCDNRMLLLALDYTEPFQLEEASIWELKTCCFEEQDTHSQRLQEMNPRQLELLSVMPSAYWLSRPPLRKCFGHGDYAFFFFGCKDFMYKVSENKWEVSPTSEHELLSISFWWDPV